MAKDDKRLNNGNKDDGTTDGATATSIATRAASDVAVVEDFGADAGKGMENLDAGEYRIPFLRILDPKSPQCAPARAGGMGAKPGSLFNIATGELYDGEEGIEFIPCHRDHNFVEWKKRGQDGSGGGFVSIHDLDDPEVLRLRAEQGRFKKLQLRGADDEDHEIAESFYLYGMLIDPYGSLSRVILGFTGMQCKKYTAFVNRYDSIKYTVGLDEAGRPVMRKPPLWAHRWLIKTQYEKRGEQSWYGWVIELAARDKDGKEDRNSLRSLVPMSDSVYRAGAEFYELINTGRAEAEYKTADQGAPADPDAISM